MKSLRMALMACCFLVIAGLLNGAEDVKAAACASQAAKQVQCLLDQQMWINGGGDGFGGAVVLGQTFVPSANGRVCKVEVMIQKNHAAAGPLTLRILRSDFTLLAAQTKNVIPIGGPQVVTFEFGCTSGPLLQGAPFYGLVLQAPAAPAAGYTWINSDDAGADAAYPAGHGWYNAAGGGAGQWIQAGYDYAFKVYICR